MEGRQSNSRNDSSGTRDSHTKYPHLPSSPGIGSGRPHVSYLLILHECLAVVLHRVLGNTRSESSRRVRHSSKVSCLHINETDEIRDLIRSTPS